MKARRESDSEIIEVEAAVYNLKNGKPYHKCLSDGHHYPASDLDFKLDADTVIQGWVARDEDGTLTLFYGSDKPSKKDNDDYWSAVFGNTLEYLPQEMFPDVTWNDPEPTRVEIIIKRKKKNL